MIVFVFLLATLCFCSANEQVPVDAFRFDQSCPCFNAGLSCPCYPGSGAPSDGTTGFGQPMAPPSGPTYPVYDWGAYQSPFSRPQGPFAGPATPIAVPMPQPAAMNPPMAPVFMPPAPQPQMFPGPMIPAPAPQVAAAQSAVATVAASAISSQPTTVSPPPAGGTCGCAPKPGTCPPCGVPRPPPCPCAPPPLTACTCLENLIELHSESASEALAAAAREEKMSREATLEAKMHLQVQKLAQMRAKAEVEAMKAAKMMKDEQTKSSVAVQEENKLIEQAKMLALERTKEMKTSTGFPCPPESPSC